MQANYQRSLDELPAIVDFTESFFEHEAVDPSLRNVVDLCVEELFVNMVTYNTETTAEILIEMQARDDGVEVSLTDYDVERFDPRSHPSPDIGAPAEQRTAGGLGLYLVMKMADSIHYEYKDRSSRITFIAKRKGNDV